jgi:hypothetical protein
MALIPVTFPQTQPYGAFQAVWSSILTASTFGSVQRQNRVQCSFQVEGTFGAGGTLTIVGSNNGVTFYPLKDMFNAALSITAAGLYLINAPCRYIAPAIASGDGTTLLTVTMFATANGIG